VMALLTEMESIPCAYTLEGAGEKREKAVA
jgi:hypothetical protein